MQKLAKIIAEQGALRNIKSNKVKAIKIIGKVQEYSEKSYSVLMELKFGEKIEFHKLFIARRFMQVSGENFYCPMWILEKNHNIINCTEIIKL